MANSSTLKVASGIANIYARDPFTAMSGHNSLNTLYDDRFCLGLGVSHIPLVTGRRGHTFGKPVATMRAYLEAMAALIMNIMSLAWADLISNHAHLLMSLSRFADMIYGVWSCRAARD